VAANNRLNPSEKRQSGLPGERQSPFFARDDSVGSEIKPEHPERVLIIEDDVLVATQMEAALSEAGFDVVGVAVSGEEALDLARLHSPGLAVVDIKLAGDRDGIDTALELFRSHGVRCIFATAYSDYDSRKRAAPANPLGWMPKPYTMPALVAMVRKASDELGDDKH
jgi:two-component system, response regulator PdtaR